MQTMYFCRVQGKYHFHPSGTMLQPRYIATKDDVFPPESQRGKPAEESSNSDGAKRKQTERPPARTVLKVSIGSAWEYNMRRWNVPFAAADTSKERL